MKKPLYEIDTGILVIHATAKGPALFLKVHRQSRDYLHHYLVPLKPHERPLKLHYQDPETEAHDLDLKVVLTPGEPKDGTPEPGDLVKAKGRYYLQVLDDPRSQRFLAYVDPETGEFAMLRDRMIEAVYADWSVEPDHADHTLESLLKDHG